MMFFTFLKPFTFVAVITLSLSALIFGCGKTGMPQPKDPSRNFTWKAIQAEPLGKCLTFTGQFNGAFQNVDRLRLEVAQVNGIDDCPGCPFVPKELLMLSLSEVGFNAEDGTIGFSYCPAPAKAYRWRLSGISKYSTIPHAVSYEQMTVIEEFY